ncbi:MAG TPA: 6-phosphogluconolactonase, partial [Actinomycetota bacterium]|nr:6-phosphogluconolactonase [Actinomycetota bacterium]
MSRVQVVADAGELAEAAARAALADLEGAIDAHETCTWVLTGGGTPRAAYRRLARHDLRDSVEWGRVWVAMGDERCVPPDDPESNWGQAADALLDHVPLPETQRLRMRGELPAEAGAKEYEAALARLPRARARPAGGAMAGQGGGLAPGGPAGGVAGGFPRLDLVWLGVGPDGHCLSLFPGRPEVEVLDRLVVPVHGAPKPP